MHQLFVAATSPAVPASSACKGQLGWIDGTQTLTRNRKPRWSKREATVMGWLPIQAQL